MTYKQTIYEHLQRYGSISNREAANRYDIYCLQERIRDLRKDGVPIVSEPKKSKTGKKYTMYHLVKEA